MDQITLNTQMRSDYGRKAAKEYRAAGLLPVNIYGLGKENLTVTIDRKEFSQIFMAGHRIFTLEVGEDKEQGVIKEVQYDALGSELLHVDFSRIDIHQKILRHSLGVNDFPLYFFPVSVQFLRFP